MLKKRARAPHLVAPFTRFVNEEAFLGLRLEERDTFVVDGSGDLFEIIPVLSDEFESYYDRKFRVLPGVGTLGLTKSGHVVADLLPCLCGETAAVRALAAAAAALASSPEAVSRRAAASGENAWLEQLYTLPDLRDATGPALSA